MGHTPVLCRHSTAARVGESRVAVAEMVGSTHLRDTFYSKPLGWCYKDDVMP